MFGSKALNLFLFALTLSAAPAATSAIKSPALLRQQDSGVRGRSLKNTNGIGGGHFTSPTSPISPTSSPSPTSAPTSNVTNGSGGATTSTNPSAPNNGRTHHPKQSGGNGNGLPSGASAARSTGSGGGGTKNTNKGGKSSRSAVVAPSKRSCVTKQDKGSVNFECQAATTNTTSNIHDSLGYRVAVKNGRSLQIGVNYQSTNSSSQNTNTTSYTLVYDRIIEYRNNASSSDGHYVWGADEIVNSYPLNTWNSLTPVTTNGTLLTFSATDGMTTFNFTIAEADTVNLTVNGMKIDFLVENYPWDPAGDTYLALISHILTHETINAAPSGPAGSSGPGGSLGPKDVQIKDVTISFNSLNGGSSSSQSKALGYTPFGSYTWADTAEAITYGVNGTNNGTTATSRSTLFGNDTTVYNTSTIQVVASTDPNATQEPGPGGGSYHEIAFSFVGAAKGADRIYWDPTVSVGYSAGVTAGVIGSLTAAVVASVAFCFAI